MIRRPPRSTLFPTRRSSDLTSSLHTRDPAEFDTTLPTNRRFSSVSAWSQTRNACRTSARYSGRSEEHTSELQSRQYLVCRLLLEKNTPFSSTTYCAPIVSPP